MNLLPVQMKALHDCRGEGSERQLPGAANSLKTPVSHSWVARVATAGGEDP